MGEAMSPMQLFDLGYFPNSKVIISFVKLRKYVTESWIAQPSYGPFGFVPTYTKDGQLQPVMISKQGLDPKEI